MRTLQLLVAVATALAPVGCGESTNPGDSDPGDDDPGHDPVAIVFGYAPENDVRQLDLYTITSESGRVPTPLIRREGMEFWPAWSPDGSRVAFASTPFPSSDNEIFVVRADGTGLTQLTSGEGHRTAPAWSPDGSRIAVVQSGSSGDMLAIMNADGTDLTPVQGTVGIFERPSWSPDGSRLAFTRRIGENAAIWVVAPDGSGMAQLTSSACGDYYPAWSPDGTKLAFSSCPRDTASGGIYVVHANGSNRRRLTTGPDDASPSWSPDGRRIVFERRLSGFPGGSDLYIANVDGGQVVNFTSTPFPQFELQPHWRATP